MVDKDKGRRFIARIVPISKEELAAKIESQKELMRKNGMVFPGDKKIRLSPSMKDVILKMRQKNPKRLLFWNYGQNGAFLDQDPVNNKTFDALYEKELIHMVVNVAAFSRYELTNLGKTIEL